MLFILFVRQVLQMLLRGSESPFSNTDLPISLSLLNLVTSENTYPCLHLPTACAERTY